jgi:hypothetical protein
MTPQQALQNFQALIRNPDLRILNLAEFEALIQSLQTLSEAVEPKPLPESSKGKEK